jgi:hypothetical protein
LNIGTYNTVEEKEDIIYSINNDEKIERQPFFSFLGDSVLNAIIINTNLPAFNTESPKNEKKG